MFPSTSGNPARKSARKVVPAAWTACCAFLIQVSEDDNHDALHQRRVSMPQVFTNGVLESLQL
jgi:hypothetical protein